MKPPKEEELPLLEVAQRLKVSSRSLWRWSAKGHIPFRWAGSNKLIEIHAAYLFAKARVTRVRLPNMDRMCTTKGCGERHQAKGFCRKCYRLAYPEKSKNRDPNDPKRRVFQRTSGMVAPSIADWKYTTATAQRLEIDVTLKLDIEAAARFTGTTVNDFMQRLFADWKKKHIVTTPEAGVA